MSSLIRPSHEKSFSLSCAVWVSNLIKAAFPAKLLLLDSALGRLVLHCRVLD